MPSEIDCHERRIENIRLEGQISLLNRRVDSMSERMDELIQDHVSEKTFNMLLDQIKETNRWLKIFGSITLLAAIFGDQAIPLIAKVLG